MIFVMSGKLDCIKNALEFKMGITFESLVPFCDSVISYVITYRTNHNIYIHKLSKIERFFIF